MGLDTNVITYLACICFLFLFGRIFIVPVKKILKLVLNSIIGGIVIFIINLVGASFGFHIGLNIYTSVLVRHFRSSWCYNFGYCKTNFMKKWTRSIF